MTDDEGWTWRGHSYAQVEPLLPAAYPTTPGVSESQRCWVGYSPARDELFVGFDLWLDTEDTDNNMGAGLARVKLATDGGKIVVSSMTVERFDKSFYSGDTIDELMAEHEDLVELDID